MRLTDPPAGASVPADANRSTESMLFEDFNQLRIEFVRTLALAAESIGSREQLKKSRMRRNILSVPFYGTPEKIYTMSDRAILNVVLKTHHVFGELEKYHRSLMATFRPVGTSDAGLDDLFRKLDLLRNKILSLQEQISNRYLLLVRKIANGFFRTLDREDAFQEARIKLWYIIERFDSTQPIPFKPYVTTSIFNKLKYLHRQARLRKMERLENVDSSEYRALEEPEPIDQDMKEQLHLALEQLSPKQKSVLLMRYWNGATLVEAGTAVGEKHKASTLRFQRSGLETLRNILGENFYP